MNRAPDFESTLARHGAFVRGVARSLVLDDQTADDVAQDTWLAAMEHPPRRPAGIRAWLGTVARRFSFRVARGDRRRAAREQRAARPEAGVASDPAQATMLREVIDSVLALEEPYRSTVLMRFYENLEPAEIATRQGIPAATVRTRLKRALDRLRDRFDDAHDGDRSAWMASLAPIAGIKFSTAAAAAAAATTTVVASSAVESGIALGGILMAKKVLISAGIAVAVAAAVTVAVVIAKRGDGESADAAQPRRAIEISEAPPPLALKPPTPGIKPSGLAPRPYVPGEEDRAPAEGPLVAKGAPHASVSGRVVDQRGTPQPGVGITLRLVQTVSEPSTIVPTSFSNERRLQARTEADGRFLFDDLPTQADVRVRARPDTLCDVWRAATITKPGPLDLGDLVATPGGSVAGTVLLPQGAPAKGVQVGALPGSDESTAGAFTLFRFSRIGDDDTRTAVTAANGQYRIDGLPEGECQVVVSPDENPDEARAGIKVRKGETNWEVDFKLTAGVSLAGVIRGPFGDPVAGATVSASQTEVKIDDPSRPPMRTRVATTGSDGRFALHGLRQEPFNVRARKPGLIGAAQDNVTPGTEVALQLRASGIAFGRVRNALTSAPVKEFTMRVVNDGMSEAANRARVLRGADAAKAAGVDEAPELFAIVDLPEQPVRLSVHADDFADSEVEGVRAAPGDKTEMNVALTPQATVRGIVRDPTGNPVAGARVVASNAKPQEPDADQNFRVRRRVVARRSSSGGSGADAAPAEAEIARSGVSGTDGAFEIKSLPGGSYRLTATHASFAESPAVAVALKPGDAVDGVTIVLEAGGTFAGRAFDADGNPLAGAKVDVRRKSSQRFPAGLAGGGREPAVTGASGDFEVTGLKAGDYLATLSEPHGEGSFQFAVSFGDEEPSPDDVALTIEAGKTTRKDLHQKPKATLSGVVKDGGKPAAGVRVSLAPKGAPVFLGQQSVKTDEQGAFVLEHVAPGDYTVSVDPPGAAMPTKKPVTLAPRADQRITIDLPSGAIEGRVLDRTTNKPVAGVTVSVAIDGPTSEQTREVRAIMITANADGDAGGIQTMSFGGSEPIRTDADGRYRLSYLAPGKYRISLKGQEIMPQSKSGIAVEERQTVKDQDFGVERGAALLVSVDTAGHDIQNVFVFATLDGSDDNGEPSHGSPKTPIRLSGLKPGHYRVRVDAFMNELEGRGEIDVAAGQEARVTVRLSEKQ